MQIQIEKNVPIPNSVKNSKGFTAALRSCEVGDSFVIPITTGRTGIYTMAKHLGRKITMRLLADKQSYRVWRIE